MNNEHLRDTQIIIGQKIRNDFHYPTEKSVLKTANKIFQGIFTRVFFVFKNFHTLGRPVFIPRSQILILGKWGNQTLAKISITLSSNYQLLNKFKIRN